MPEPTPLNEPVEEVKPEGEDGEPEEE